ncbi:endonuclease domain-containing protein [Phenylobacterium sp. VNQ135]|uniref:endonuclease domain-containing protein n=1 Tax=Phenylobacterium sp. VNQ135 TaxID=3400922 RepID=UPI003C0C7441
MRSSILTSKRAKALRRAMTEPEVMLWSRLKKRLDDGLVFRRQHALGPYILDFFCPAVGLAIEVDGAIHGHDAQLIHDQRRDDWLRSQGVTVYRIPASGIYEDLNQVADGVRRLAAELLVRPPAPSTPRSSLRSAGGPPPPSSSRRGR